MTIKDIKIGQLFVTGPAKDVFCKIDDKTAADIVTGGVRGYVSVRGCQRAKPADLHRAARKLKDHQLFHPESETT